MKFNNEITLDAQPEELFAFLSDVERVAPCLPGAHIEGREGDDYQGSMRVKVGPVTTEYRGTLRFVELDDAQRRAVISARATEASGQGSAAATIVTSITEFDAASHVTLETDLQVRGRVAQFGRGAMERVAERMFAQFAQNLEHELKGGKGEPSPAAAATESEAGATSAPGAGDGSAVAPAADPAGAPGPSTVDAGVAGPSRVERPNAAASRLPQRSDDALDVLPLIGGVLMSGVRRWAPAFLAGMIIGYLLAKVL